MLKEMSFCLLRDKQLVLPNSQGVSLSDKSSRLVQLSARLSSRLEKKICNFCVF